MNQGSYLDITQGNYARVLCHDGHWYLIDAALVPAWCLDLHWKHRVYSEHLGKWVHAIVMKTRMHILQQRDDGSWYATMLLIQKYQAPEILKNSNRVPQVSGQRVYQKAARP